MLSVLDSPTLRARVSPLSVASYHNLGEFNEHGRRTELIRGIVVEKMSKSPLHTSIATHLYRLILARIPEGYSAWKEEPLTLRDSEPEPDVSVVKADWSAHDHGHPTTAALVIEVAVSTPDDDRAMAEIYAEAGVGEYWVVLAKERAIEVFRQPEGLAYREMRRYEFADELACSTVPGVKVVLAELFAGISA